jgi:pyruvate/2-oxoglutarate dehydrogenase complex dihydrolipoamide acyltransferase (E2) component
VPENEHVMAMPRLGISMQEGTIVKWMKSAGEEVTAGEILLTIENDKVEIDVETPWSGVVLELLADEGEVVPVLHPIARIRAT